MYITLKLNFQMFSFLLLHLLTKNLVNLTCNILRRHSLIVPIYFERTIQCDTNSKRNKCVIHNKLKTMKY